jgi:hypothetical protein
MKALPVGTRLTFSEVKILLASKEGYSLKRRVNTKGSTIIERFTPKGIIDCRFIVSSEHKYSSDTRFSFSESDDSDTKLRVYFCRPAKIVEYFDI